MYNFNVIYTCSIKWIIFVWYEFRHIKRQDRNQKQIINNEKISLILSMLHQIECIYWIYMMFLFAQEMYIFKANCLVETGTRLKSSAYQLVISDDVLICRINLCESSYSKTNIKVKLSNSKKSEKLFPVSFSRFDIFVKGRDF